MKVGVIGPLCRDSNIIGDRTHHLPGGVTYYAGEALANMRVETVLFASFGANDQDLADGLHSRVIQLPAEGTIEFINEYSHGIQARSQKAVAPRNCIGVSDVDEHYCRNSSLSSFDYFVLGPLLHNNLDPKLAEELKTYADVILSAQGTIRHLDGDMVDWKDPERLLAFLPFVEYVFLDSFELRYTTGEHDIRKSVGIFRDHGATNVVVTMGEEGSWLFLGDENYRIKAYQPNRIVDPTGAGDTYMAGFICALNAFRHNPWKLGKFAAWAATMSMENPGAFSGNDRQVRRRLGIR